MNVTEIVNNKLGIPIYICKRDKIRTVNWKTFLCFMMVAVIIDKSIVCTNDILFNKLKQYVYASYLV